MTTEGARPLKTPASAAGTAEARVLAVEEVIGRAPPLYRGMLRKAFQGEGSPRAAIKAHCLYCAGFVREEVAECRVLRCPMWLWRPYQKRGAAEAAEGDGG